jgi:hypothetical protein
MATARILDMEASAGQRPQRPDVLPSGAPDSAVLPDVPLTSGEKEALRREDLEEAGRERIPAGGLPEGIPHGDRRPGAKPRHST